MKQEYKDLLLKDLCARLPYDIKIKTSYDKMDEPIELIFINPRNESFAIGSNFTLISGLDFDTYECKPYLFPFSSMTDEQKEEYNQSRLKDLRMLNSVLMERISDENNFDRLVVAHNEIDWLNKNHFDYRGLIPMGLANDATGLNIY